MVKLEDSDGDVAFIAPEHVTCLTTVNAGTTKVWDVSGRALDVDGTPDEVHTKLFPIARDEREVWEWLLGEDGPAYLPEWVGNYARKALGR